jgi:ABC-type phosphate transport system substrate-binding protein
MRKLTRLMVGAVTMAAAAALVAGSVTAASADPIGKTGKAVVPASYDIVGVGSDTTTYVFDQFAVNYNKTVKVHNAAHPFLYSWDALPKGASEPNKAFKITPKAGCTSIGRPDGSGAGLKTLDMNQLDRKTGHYCVDFGRSSSGRSTGTPTSGPDGVLYVTLAKDAITWAARSPKAGGTDAPATLNTAQLKSIFTCKVNNWSQVGGKPGAIKVYLPQAGSGTLSTWEKFMGIVPNGPVGSCVSQAPEENEGTYSGFNTKNAIAIYSIGAYVAQKYHEAACGGAKPTAKQNEFGCNLTGVLALGDISGKAPIIANKTNTNFPSSYFRTIYDIVRDVSPKGKAAAMAPALRPIFSRTGYLCSAAARPTIADYGFIPTPLCGSFS